MQAADKVAPVSKEQEKEWDQKQLSARFGAIKSVSDVPNVCVRVVDALSRQEVFEEDRGYRVPPYRGNKVLALSFDLSRIVEMVHYAAMKKKDMGLSIKSFGSGDHGRLYAASGVVVETGLKLSVKEGSTAGLGALYKEVMQALSSGWVKSDPKDFSDTLGQKDPEAWHFLIKSETFCEEATLIRFISSHLLLHEKNHCDNWWKDKGEREPSYWWIKKDSYSEVAKAFGLSEDLVKDK